MEEEPELEEENEDEGEDEEYNVEYVEVSSICNYNWMRYSRRIRQSEARTPYAPPMWQNFEESDDEEDEIEEAAEMVYERLQGSS